VSNIGALATRDFIFLPYPMDMPPRVAFDRHFLKERDVRRVLFGVARVDVARLEQLERLVSEHYWSHDVNDNEAARTMVAGQLVPLMSAVERDMADDEGIFVALAHYAATIKDDVVRHKRRT
jgi:hypothetical protein